MNSKPRRVAVLGGIRIPFARQNGPYARASNQDMLTATLDALIDKFDLQGETLGEVAAGAVLKHSRDFNLTRECVLGSKLAPETPGLRRPAGLRNRAGDDHPDRQQDRPGPDRVGHRRRRRYHLRCADRHQRRPPRGAARSSTGPRATPAGFKRWPGSAPSSILPEIPRNAEPRTGLSMGEHTAIMAKEWGIGREEQDELAVASHHKLAAAYDSGFLDELVIPFLGLERDQNLRPDSSLEKLAKLRPVFGGPEGTMTAGNSTPLSDGASAVLLASEEWAVAARPPGAGLLRRRPDGRRRLRAQARRPADGARLRRSPAAWPAPA